MGAVVVCVVGLTVGPCPSEARGSNNIIGPIISLLTDATVSIV